MGSLARGVGPDGRPDGARRTGKPAIMREVLYIFAFLLVGIAFASITLQVSRLLRPEMGSPIKGLNYECGEIPIGEPWIRFRVAYYIFALIFAIFDIEAVFLYPWAVIFKSLGMFGFVEMMVFIAILVLGLAYAWAKGVLSWV